MLMQQLNERMIIGSVYCIYKNQSENRIFQPSKKLCFKDYSPVPIMVGHIRDTGYKRLSSTLKVFDSHVNSERNKS